MGINLSEFLKMTPRDFHSYVDAYFMKKEAEYQENITLAYMTAAWAAQWFSDTKPQPLDKILNYEKQNEEMTDEQMLKQVKLLNALFGGEVKEDSN